MTQLEQNHFVVIVIPSEARNPYLATFVEAVEIPRFARNDEKVNGFRSKLEMETQSYVRQIS